MAKPRKVDSPEKELRFTRARQAHLFFGVAILMFCVSLFLLLAAFPLFSSTNMKGPDETLLASPWWALIPLPFVALFFWIGMNLSRHAFLLLTPIGIEIFPFWRPQKNLNVIPWPEVANAHVTNDFKMLVIDIAGAGDSKVFVSLDPIPKDRLPLLAQAIDGRMEQNAARVVP